MPRFIRKIDGADERALDKRFEPAVAAVDTALVTIGTSAEALERTHLLGATREAGRLAYKYGPDSPQVAEAKARVRRAEQRLTAIRLEIERARAPVAQADPHGVVVHGRVLDTAHAGQPKLTVAIIGPAGRAVARTTTDDGGYFTLAAKPFAATDTVLDASAAPDAGPARAPRTTPSAAARAAAMSRRPRLIVSDSRRELHAEDLEPLEAGQTRYREIVLRTVS